MVCQPCTGKSLNIFSLKLRKVFYNITVVDTAYIYTVVCEFCYLAISRDSFPLSYMMLPGIIFEKTDTNVFFPGINVFKTPGNEKWGS